MAAGDIDGVSGEGACYEGGSNLNKAAWRGAHGKGGGAGGRLRRAEMAAAA